MAESSQKKLSRVRKPSVHITYDVETGGALQKVELPFIVGVMGDFSGDATAPLKPLKERKFAQIDIHTFDNVMKSMNAGLRFRVDNTMTGDGSELGVDLKFESMDDFSPERVARQVPALKDLLDRREQLLELIAKVDRSDDLERLLSEAVTDSDVLAKLSKELGLGDAAADSASKDSE